jgi:O-antigen/teichoic acid export membrane protein
VRFAKVRAQAELAWGGIDQALSSATNLGLSILAGRLLGASGLGVIFIGFSAYLFCLSLARGFITSPFVIATSALEKAERDVASRRCMTLIFATAVLISVLMFAIGMVVPDPFGQALLVFAPWVGIGVVQDQWRSIFFRDQRGSSAALNDGVWALGMIAMLPVARAFPNDWSVAAVWGSGAAIAALVGWWQVRLLPSGFREAKDWWTRDLRHLGSWLAMESIVVSAGSQAGVIILAVILSTSDLGGIRVVQVVFAPMSLVNEAFTFPGVPIVARALAVSMAAARRWAWQLGAGALAVVGLYLAVVIPLSGQILTRVFGPEFKQFTPLVLPTALSQLPVAAAIGFLILLKADRRVHAIVTGIAIRNVASLILAPIMAIKWGVEGAVWSTVITSTLAALLTVYFGLLPGDIPFFGRRNPAMNESVAVDVGAD